MLTWAVVYPLITVLPHRAHNRDLAFALAHTPHHRPDGSCDDLPDHAGGELPFQTLAARASLAEGAGRRTQHKVLAPEPAHHADLCELG